jgi:hypothetical protein
MRYSVIGTTDERNQCDCCGRSDLKRVVAMDDHEAGIVVYFGTTCAAKMARVPVKVLRGMVSAEEERQRKAEQAERARRDAEKSAAWDAHLIRMTGGIMDWQGKPDRFAMIEALGGYRAARAGFSWSAA